MTAGYEWIDKDGYFNKEEMLPLWFVEVMPQTIAGDIIYSISSELGGLDGYSTDEYIKDVLSKLTENTAVAAYGFGYLASLYLGQMASG